MIIGNYEKFCKDYHLCEGYESAVNSSEDFFLHHIQGEKISREELKENNLYYDCPPENLRWVTREEHTKIHNEGKVNSEETRQKISKALTGKYKGENHHFFGKSHSLESIKKISEGNKGKVLSDETKRKMSIGQKCRTDRKKGENHPLFGKPLSDETRRKLSIAQKGKTSPNKGRSWKLVNGKRKYSEVKNG